MPNIEIKARYDDLDNGRQVARNLGARFVGKDYQLDTYFKTAKGRLKLRESSLSGGQLIPYVRGEQAAPKKSDYLVVKLEDCATCKRLLSEILGVEIVVEKTRDIFLLENVRVHLDEVKRLGKFLELEAVYENTSENDERAQYEKIEKLMKAFGINQNQLLTGSYRELVQH